MLDDTFAGFHGLLLARTGCRVMQILQADQAVSLHQGRRADEHSTMLCRTFAVDITLAFIMPILRICFLVALAIGCVAAQADDAAMPNFSSKPKKYANRHEIGFADQSSAFVDDELVIGDVTREQLKFWFWIIGANGHQCSASGTAQKAEIGYVYTEETMQEILDEKCFARAMKASEMGKSYEESGLKGCYVEASATCSLLIVLGPDTVMLKDQGGFCQRRYCGSRAFIDETTFIANK